MEKSDDMRNKVVIIGCGNVGMSYAYALINQKTFVTDLVLIDIDSKRVEGEAMDLSHGIPFAPSKVNVKAGTYEDCKDAKIVCICAGANQKPGETRLDLIKKNYQIFKSLIPQVMDCGFQGIFLVATNPVDAMSYFTYRLSGLPASHVIGSGTTLDTSRLRFLISEKLGINAKNIHAYVLGEHGDSEFVPWSHASVGLDLITSYLSEAERNKLCDEVKNAAYEVIQRKGVTNYGIGMCLVRITNAILGDENTILSVSTYHEKEKVFISTPSIMNHEGVKKQVLFPLTEEEQVRLDHSMKVIREAILSVEHESTND